MRFVVFARRTAHGVDVSSGCKTVMSSVRSKACLLGSFDSWDMTRALGLAGIDCALVTDPDDYVRFSRFVKVVLDRADSTASPDVLLDTLRDFSRTQAEKPTLYYSTDADLLFVSRNRERLSQDFNFIVADPEHVEVLQNKELFRQLAEDKNLPVPRGQTVTPASQPPCAIKLPFPIILKPAEREVPLDPGSTPVRDLVGSDIKCVGVSNRSRGKDHSSGKPPIPFHHVLGSAMAPIGCAVVNAFRC